MKCVVSGKDNGPSWRKPIAPPCWMSPCAKYPLFYPHWWQNLHRLRLSCFIGGGGFLSRGLASKKGLQQLPIVLVNLLKIRWFLTAGDWLLFQVNAHFVIFLFKKSQFILSSTKAFNTHGDLDLLLLLVIADVTKKEEQTVAWECFLQIRLLKWPLCCIFIWRF